jgi:DNA-binding NtrC family response regulator
VGISDEAMMILQAYQWPGNVRELRNLVESMVVLAPGTKIGASDIPPEVRSVDRRHALVPIPPPRVERAGEEAALRPQLEFVFRTLVEMRVDMDELRRDFEEYRRSYAPRAIEARPGRSLGWSGPDRPGLEMTGSDSQEAEVVDAVGREVEGASPPAAPPSDSTPEGVVVYRAGMTMDDVEREAILAALAEVAGNRRRAAERLGIGERTLYRKIRKYGLEG